MEGGKLERHRFGKAGQTVLRGDVAGLERRRGQAVSRRDHAEAAVAGSRERVPGVLREQERRGEEQREQRVPALFREVAHRRNVLEARVRDHRVQPAEALERAVHDRAVAVARRQVGVVDVHGMHRPAVRLEPLDDRRADSAARARHQRDAIHV